MSTILGPFSGEAMIQMATTLVSTAHAAKATTNQADTVTNTNPFDESFELAAGASITLYSSFTGNPSVQTPTAGDVQMWVEIIADNQTVAGAWTSPSGIVASQKVLTLAGGWSGGTVFNGSSWTWTAPAAGTYRLRLRVDYAQVTADGTAGGYHADSDDNFLATGTPNTWSHTSANWKASAGYLRAGVNVSAASVSNVSPGGATPTTWTYPDKVYEQLTVSSAANAQDQSATLTASSTQAGGHSHAFTPGATTTWGDATGFGSLDKTDLPSGHSGTFTPKLVPANSALSGQPWVHFISVPTGWTLGAAGAKGTGAVSITGPAQTLDVGIRVQHYMALNDNTYPPVGSADGPPASDTSDVTHDVTQRLNTSIGFVAARATNARSEVVSGVTWTRHLQDAGHLVADVVGDSVTTTAHGWDPSFIQWVSQLPSGSWVDQRVITAPAGLVGCEVGGSGNLTLLAKDPNYNVICGIGPATVAAEANHWVPGQDLLFGLTVLNVQAAPTTAVLVAMNGGGASSVAAGLIDTDASNLPRAYVVIGRFNQSTGNAEFLAADYTWHPILGNTVHWWQLAESYPGSRVFVASIAGANTAAWGDENFEIKGLVFINGTPYDNTNLGEVVGPAHSHAGLGFNALLAAGVPIT